jgi:hypothetical protein
MAGLDLGIKVLGIFELLKPISTRMMDSSERLWVSVIL